VTFTPTRRGRQSGALTINDNTNESPHKVQLLGAGK